MKQMEQFAVATKRAIMMQKIGCVFHTKEREADCDSGWRVQVGDEDEKCFDRAEYLDLISLKEVCEIVPDFQRIMKQQDEAVYQLSNGRFERKELELKK